jgi:hypothetical protein
MPTIQRADPAARRRAVRLLVVAAVFGTLLILAFEYLFSETWLNEHVEFLLENSYLVFVLFLLLGLPLVGASIYLLSFAGKVSGAGRFPPSGVSVTRDTVVLEGAAAQRRAWMIRMLAAVLVLVATGTPFFMWYLFVKVAAQF